LSFQKVPAGAIYLPLSSCLWEKKRGKRKQKVRNEGGKERQIGARARGSHGDLKKETREGLFLVFSRFISCSLELQREQSGSLASHLALGKKRKTRKKRKNTGAKTFAGVSRK
jgi:hypothetical protein